MQMRTQKNEKQLSSLQRIVGTETGTVMLGEGNLLWNTLLKMLILILLWIKNLGVLNRN